MQHLKDLIIITEESLNLRQGASPGMDTLNSTNNAFLQLQPQLRWQAAASQALTELEGPDAIYKPMFGPETIAMVSYYNCLQLSCVLVCGK